MKTRPLETVLSLLLLTTAARADVGPRPRPPGNERAVPFVIEVDDNARQARLQVPSKFLGAFRAGAEKGAREEEARLGGPTRLHTIVAGVGLSLALAFGGFWLVRRGQPGSRALALLAGSALLLGIGAAA